MGEANFRTTSNSALDAPPMSSRQVTPSEKYPVQPAHETLPRPAKPVRKDSKIGLRGIFSRSKTSKADKDGEEASSRPTGLRASLVELSHWPSRPHSSADSRSREFAATRQQVPLGNRLVASWNPPPFFQVYPQAVKHATLPVCKMPTETLARHNNMLAQGRRFAPLEHGPNTTKRDTLKRRQRVCSIGHSRDWVNKIFVLISSGYLLQYAVDGTFDRMPEKLLQLTATSAAFASDLVPGRHWVLQVASTTDVNGSTIVDPKPRRSKLAPRENEQVPAMLLILENAESMDDWLAALRREIEFQGGKKKMSETGQLEVDSSISSRLAQSNCTAVIAQDSDRPSPVTTQESCGPQEGTPNDTRESGFATSQPDRASIYSMDNSSATASMASSEGRRLDTLRHSGSSHRFSYISSGQRTMVTSADSSPACSPTRASFSSQGEDMQASPKSAEVRLRPNASAIVSRRQSIQAMISLFEAPIEEQPPHEHATSPVTASNEHEHPSTPSTPSVPNFSVPHTASKRFSLTTSAPNGSSPTQQTLEYDRAGKTSRKLPPTALLMSRPLSIVMDQPSPRSPRSLSSVSRSFDSREGIQFHSNDAGAILGTSPEQDAYTTAPPSRSHGGNKYGRLMPNPSLLYGKAITARKSMPQLTEGPPPAPPPNYALPPIPRSASAAHHSIRL
ncbi:hypothetical protein GGS21DRAFT_224155 [Xylaria nigripes]|nr:hypothetical protein GGS21DRAFT_224155 [Xylaria nigripes]